MSALYSEILVRHYGDRLWSILDEDYSTLEIMDDGPPITQADLDSLWPATQTAIGWERVRAQRDELLAASDWTQTPDAPVDQQAWADYRQTLRDIPQTQDDPDSIVWPEQP